MASTVFPFSSFPSSVFLLSQGQSMEINFSCLLAVVNTIAFDLCYLLAICIHKRLLFIIIVFLSSSPISYLYFFQQYFASFPVYMKQCLVSWGVLYWPWGKFFNRGVTRTKTCKQCKLIACLIFYLATCFLFLLYLNLHVWIEQTLLRWSISEL